MQITAALAGVRLAANLLDQFFRRAPAPKTVDADPRTGRELPLAGGGVAGLLRQISARYDLTDISPDEFSNMLQELRQAGLLTDGQYHELSLIRLDLAAAGVQADESLDLLHFYAQKLAEPADSAAGPAPSLAAGPSLGPAARRYDWLQKLALLQSAPGAALDALA